MSVLLFDKLDVNHGCLLSLPFREATGTITRDRARPHHEDVDLVGVPAWTSIASGIGVLNFNGATDYLELAFASCADLDFTIEDYSIAVWIYHTAAAQSDIIVGRYGVNLDGWEFYIGPALPRTLELRHHHAPDRSGCYSEGWLDNTWYLAAVSRSGLYPQMYRNGATLDKSYTPGGMQDPSTCNRDLVVGTRFTKDANWYHGMMWNLRIWDRALTAEEMLFLFEYEKHWFGVT